MKATSMHTYTFFLSSPPHIYNNKKKQKIKNRWNCKTGDWQQQRQCRCIPKGGKVTAIIAQEVAEQSEKQLEQEE